MNVYQKEHKGITIKAYNKVNMCYGSFFFFFFSSKIFLFM